MLHTTYDPSSLPQPPHSYLLSLLSLIGGVHAFDPKISYQQAEGRRQHYPRYAIRLLSSYTGAYYTFVAGERFANNRKEAQL